MDDKKEGHGVFIWPDGRKYVGNWMNGHQDGIAHFTSANGHTRQGCWKNGKLYKWVGKDNNDRKLNGFSGENKGDYDVSD